ncbi:MAG: hypothetical protein NZ769_03385 [Anaerolineae bacterium]|nr:hypothetical protein [Anaerolineae bacterium]MCX8066302.1 hypothetical protein [Anaerolineae bacterium]
MAEWVTAEKVLALADRLPPLEKLRLIEWLLSRLERELQATYSRPTRLARGVWRGLNLTEEEIADVRQELWGRFPREI